MYSEVLTPKGRKRVRIRKRIRLDEPDMTAASKARDESFAKAPRAPNGKIVSGYARKAVLEAYREHGLEPKTNYDEPSTWGNKPLFVKDPEVAKRIVKFFKKGYPVSAICRYVGITRPTLMEWLAKGQEGHPVYRDFYERVCKAEAKAEMDKLDELERYGKGEWKATAWLMERRWPENWSRGDRARAQIDANIEITVKNKENLGQQVVTDVDSRELARRLIDGNEYGYKAIEDRTK